MEGKEFLGPLVAAPNAHPPHPSFIRSLSVPRLRETQMNQARKSKIEALRKEAKEDFMRILRRRCSCTAAPITMMMQTCRV